MPVTAKMYTNALKPFMMGLVNWKAAGGSVIKCALLTSAYTPNQDADIFFNSCSAYEVVGAGYTAGGAIMVPLDPTVDLVSNETRCDANDVSWPTSTITARYAVIYYSTGTPATSNLIGYVDFGQDMISNLGTFTITWAPTGVFKNTIG